MVKVVVFSNDWRLLYLRRNAAATITVASADPHSPSGPL